MTQRDPLRHRVTNRRAALALFGLSGGGILASAGYGVYRLLPGRVQEGTTAMVPAVAGLTRERAVEALDAAHLGHRFSEGASDTVPAGRIIRSEPAAGSRVDAEERVILVVSTGADHVAVPRSLVGAAEANARSSLTAAGLAAGESIRANGTKPKGTVLAVSPEPGTDVPRGTTVFLTVATGSVMVPKVVGMTLAEARKTLGRDDLRLPVKVSYASGTGKPGGTVTRQSVRAHETVAAGTAVTLVVAVGRSRASRHAHSAHGGERSSDRPAPKPAATPSPSSPPPTPPKRSR